jgi:choice-of-anchor B domain-containing protein
MKKLLLLISCVFIASFSYSQVNLTQLGYLSYAPQSVAGVWHYVDSVGHEYALVGAADRVSIVDVTNPSAPVEVQVVQAIPGQESLWREIKTYGHYAYAGSEGGGGIIVMDLSNLPGPISSYHYYGDGAIANQITTTHTVAVADGYLYIFGSGNGLSNGGAVICDLADPYNPVYVGMYDQNYVHDGYIRNDTLWAGEIYSGQFSVIDVSDKSNPILLTTQVTPGAFCHNTWLSDNSTYLFTTDELNNVPLGSFDVHDINNIKLLDTYFTDSMPTQEVHNVRVLNDFLINPSYGSQLVICDGARPSNIIEIANYPTGNFLNWDASPYLPSGNIISTDVDGGFYVFAPNYVRACYLEGNVVDSITGAPLNNVKVEVNGLARNISTDLLGDFRDGTVYAGTYDIDFSKPGYKTKTYPATVLANGVLTNLNVQLVPLIITGTVNSSVFGNGIANATVYFNNGTIFSSVQTDGNGNFTINSLSSGTYEITASSWGYISQCQTILVDGSSQIIFSLDNGYYDDFTGDNGWTINSTATTGIWTRVIPAGTTFQGNPSNPGVDVSFDCGNEAYVTGNIVGSSPNTDDVDNGFTTLTSPSMDLTTYADPYLDFYRWFYIQNGIPAASSDTLFISISDGTNTQLIDYATLGTVGNSSWIGKVVRVADYLVPTNSMKMILTISDKPTSGNIVEAGLDHFRVTEGTTGIVETKKSSNLTVVPNPFTNQFSIKISSPFDVSNAIYILKDYSGKVIQTGGILSNNLEISQLESLASGLYFVTVQNDKGFIQTVKVIKTN